MGWIFSELATIGCVVAIDRGTRFVDSNRTMPQTVNIAVFGFGYWGPNLVRNFRSHGSCAVRVVCDPDEASRRRVRDLYPEIVAVADPKVVLADAEIDAVAIATPAHTHYPLAKASLVQGKHTLIEKPMATSSAHCRELIRTAHRAQRTLMVDHTFIYSGPVRVIKEIIDSGDLGDVLHISTQRLNLGLFQNDINVTWDLAPHDLSIVLHLLGRRPLSVNCQGQAHVTPDVADVTSMSLAFPGGQFAMIQSSWIDPVKVRRIAVVGSKKMILYDDTEPQEKVKIFDKRVEASPRDATDAECRYAYHDGDRFIPRFDQSEPLRKACHDFVEAIRHDGAPKVTGEDGLGVVEILEAAEASLRAGGRRYELRQPDAAVSEGRDSLLHAAPTPGLSPSMFTTGSAIGNCVPT